VLFEPFCPVDTVLFLLYCVDKINIHSFIIGLTVGPIVIKIIIINKKQQQNI